MKRLQNIVAESRQALPIATVYGLAVWLMAGAIQKEWWIQMGCFLLSVLLMMHLNNKNLLIRIYSRSVSVTFILLSCAAVFLFPSLSGNILQVCMIASLVVLCSCYQDNTTVGLTYYCFLLLGLGSCADIYFLWFVPVYWLLMAIIVYSLSWRTFFASLLGLLTPYWFLATWLLFTDEGSLTALADHFAALTDLQIPDFNLQLLFPSLLFLGLLTCMGIMGCIHFVRTSYLDKIRVRQLYYGFMLLGAFSLAGIALQPQHFDMFVRMLIISTSPLFGHFAALTHTKLTNVTCLVLTALIVVLTAYNLWISSSPF